ncbi:hypothetical protein MOF38_07570 [Bacillus haynesii]|uniref:hypothetical protein n=1 Tax=Bacillus haynesii TaxID=1925021 RepID=UPI0022829295|nr:hypothetical protein [Bacillus haynesii]MCY9277528.1 hypothetical protein [Bacillus haynesii]MCY9399648.1 hypothetical protein [Bacillus haynesii]
MSEFGSEVLAEVVERFHLATKKHKYWTDEVNVFRDERELECALVYFSLLEERCRMILCCGR